MDGYQFQEEDFEFFCPYSQDIFVDPVKAEDGKTYDRSSIEGWFESLRRRGRPIVSPVTLRAMGTGLVPDAAAAAGAQRLRQAMARTLNNPAKGIDLRAALQGVSSIHDLRNIFDMFDDTRDLLAQALEGWQPPQVVVMGQESSGKSSVLERLAMMSIFPRDKTLCTRMPIHVRLRNVDKCEPATLEVHNVVTGKTEEEAYVIPTAFGAVHVREKMREIIEKEHGNAGGGHCVSTERIIILTVKSPHVPSIDMVDMPGLVTAPESMKQGTRKLVEGHIERHGQYSMYLATVVATSAPNQSVAMDIVQSKKLEDKTIGVFTKCDHVMALADEKDMFLARMQSEPPEGCGAVPLSQHGWVAVMNASAAPAAAAAAGQGPNNGNEQSSFARLKQQAVDEESFVREKLAGVIGAGRAGCGALVERLQGWYLQCVRESWAPGTIRLVKGAIEKAGCESAGLGVPEFEQGGRENAERARQGAAKEALRKMGSGTDGLMDGCWDQVLDKVKEELVGILGESISGAKASSVPARWRAQQAKFDATCTEAVEAWARYWASNVRRVLQEMEADGGAGAGAGFVLGRFPLFIDAVVDSVERAVAQQKEVLEQLLKGMGAWYYGMKSPWVKARTKFARGGAATITLACDHLELVESVMFTFVEASTLGILDEVKSKLVHISGSVGDAGWIEGCAEERKALRVRIKDLEDAKARIVTMLGAESEEALLAEAAALALQRGSRYIARPALS